MPQIVIPSHLNPKETFPEMVINLLTSGRQIFGAPGASLTWGIPDGDVDEEELEKGVDVTAQVRAGIEGEKQTAKILDEWAAGHPSVVVIHSVRLPGVDTADTDHMVVMGKTVIIVDSKRWMKSRNYSVTASMTIKRGTVNFPSGKVSIAFNANTWRKHLRRICGDVKVRGIICIAQEKVNVVRDKNWYRAPFRLVEAEKMVGMLDEVWDKLDEKDRDTVHLGVVVDILKHAIKPRNRREEVVNVKGFK